jgi:hypothetical protein
VLTGWWPKAENDPLGDLCQESTVLGVLSGLMASTRVGAIGTGRLLSCRLVPVVPIAAVGVLAPRHRRDLNRARAHIDTGDRRALPTESSTLECSENGAGDPVLVSRGISHGRDGGLSSARVLNPIGGTPFTMQMASPRNRGWLSSPTRNSTRSFRRMEVKAPMRTAGDTRTFPLALPPAIRKGLASVQSRPSP